MPPGTSLSIVPSEEEPELSITEDAEGSPEGTEGETDEEIELEEEDASDESAYAEDSDSPDVSAEDDWLALGLQAPELRILHEGTTTVPPTPMDAFLQARPYATGVYASFLSFVGDWIAEAPSDAAREFAQIQAEVPAVLPAPSSDLERLRAQALADESLRKFLPCVLLERKNPPGAVALRNMIPVSLASRTGLLEELEELLGDPLWHPHRHLLRAQVQMLGLLGDPKNVSLFVLQAWDPMNVVQDRKVALRLLCETTALLAQPRRGRRGWTAIAESRR